MFCTRCGANNIDTDQFCRSCGATLVKSGGAQGAPSGSDQQPYPYSTPSASQQQQQHPYSTPSASQQQQQPQGYTPYPGYQGYPPPQYGYANQMYSQQGSASGRAIASMILSIISIFTCGPLLSIPGMILGKMEMNAILQGQAPPAGENFAKAGFYVGLVVTILTCLGGLAYMFLVLGIASGSIR